MTYTKEENEAYQAKKLEKNLIDRQERKKRKMGVLFHRSTKIGPTGKPIGNTFKGVCDDEKAKKLASRAEKY